MVNRTFTPGQLTSMRGAGIVPMYYCADCRMEVEPERWPNHYRTAQHRAALRSPSVTSSPEKPASGSAARRRPPKEDERSR